MFKIGFYMKDHELVPIEIKRFPDHTLNLNLNSEKIDYEFFWARNYEVPIVIKWNYEDDSELFILQSIMNVLRKKYTDIKYILDLPYVPNARMDRVHSVDEAFTLKTFANFINSFGFESVYVYDVHSHVAEALINNIKVIEPHDVIRHAIQRAFNHLKSIYPDLEYDTLNDHLVVVFPDEGACKRYVELPEIAKYHLPVAFGIKNRDWETHKIKSYDIWHKDIDLTDKYVLIIDDICSYGNTFDKCINACINEKAIGGFLAISHAEDPMLYDQGAAYHNDHLLQITTSDSIMKESYVKEHDILHKVEIVHI